MKAEDGNVVLFGKTVSELQDNVNVSGDSVTGTLKYVTGYTEFSSKTEEQSGNYLALNFANNDFSKYSSVKVGLDPSYASGLVEIINDPDKNGVFRITNTSQVFKIQSTDAETGLVSTQEFDLSNLVLEV